MNDQEKCLKIKETICNLINIKDDIQILPYYGKNLNDKIIYKTLKKDNNIIIYLYNNILSRNTMEVTTHIISCFMCIGEDNIKQDYYYLISNYLILRNENDIFLLDNIIKRWSRISIKKGKFILNLPRKNHMEINKNIKNHIKNKLHFTKKYSLDNLKQEIINVYNDCLPIVT